MIANVTLKARGAPIFYGKIDLRLLIKAVNGKESVLFTFCKRFQVGITMFYFKDSGSVLIRTACAFGVGIATVTVLLCGRFVVLSRKN